MSVLCLDVCSRDGTGSPGTLQIIGPTCVPNIMSWRVCLTRRQNSRYFLSSGLKDEKLKANLYMN